MKKALAYLASDMERVETIIVDTLRFRDSLMGAVGQFLAALKGKRLRPMMTLIAAKLCAPESIQDRHIRVAAGMELVHLATLLHDDVIDHATSRRGQPSVNAQWGADVAILMADYLFSAAFSMIHDDAGPGAVTALTRATCQMCEGELFEIEKRHDILSVEDYLKVIEAKTARLFSVCAEVGGLVSQAPPEQTSHLRAFGLDFGMAFQITDDLLDYTAREVAWGKRIGADIANGKQTLPFIYALNNASETDRQFLLASLNNGDGALGRILECIQANRGVDLTRDMVTTYTDRALDNLRALPDGEARSHLERLALFVRDREY